jgi:hypothetical protein
MVDQWAVNGGQWAVKEQSGEEIVEQSPNAKKSVSRKSGLRKTVIGEKDDAGVQEGKEKRKMIFYDYMWL